MARREALKTNRRPLRKPNEAPARFHEVLHGDCLKMLKTLDTASVHAVVSDPPAGISFMGKGWDDDKGGRKEWIVWLTEVMIEVKRVLKPGGHILIWALPRTSHWTATAVEDAGFEIRDVITHLFGSGYPKGQDVSKILDKRCGQERKVIGKKSGSESEKVILEITAATSAEAKKWEGWSAALKPAFEPWILARNPLANKTVRPSSENWILARAPLAFETLAENVKRCGAGALNIDGTRVPIVNENIEFKFSETAPHGTGNSFHMVETTVDKVRGMTWQAHDKGRWPANIVLSHAEGCVKTGETQVIKGQDQAEEVTDRKPKEKGAFAMKQGTPIGDEVIDVWNCAEDCPIKVMDEQAGQQVSRYFNRFEYEPPFTYTAKASIAERNVGTEGLTKDQDAGDEAGDGVPKGKKPKGNIHPTVKSIALMSHLIKLITPPGGTVLDPFAGSGTTIVAAKRIGRSGIGIERDYTYWKICKARLDNGGAYV